MKTMVYSLNFKSLKCPEFVFVVIAIFFIMEFTFHINATLCYVFTVKSQRAQWQESFLPSKLTAHPVNVTRIMMIKYVLAVTLSMNEHEWLLTNKYQK